MIGEITRDGCCPKHRCANCHQLNTVTVTWEEIRIASAGFVPAAWQPDPDDGVLRTRVACAVPGCAKPIVLEFTLLELKEFLLEGVKRGYVDPEPYALPKSDALS